MRTLRRRGDPDSSGREGIGTGYSFATLSIGRKLAYGYATAAIVLLVILALRAPTAEAWFWRALLVVMFLVVSLRSALVWSYRREPSDLNWWLRPAPIVEHEFTVTWLVYAVVFAAFSALFLFL
jgi:hypothetical protein